MPRIIKLVSSRYQLLVAVLVALLTGVLQPYRSIIGFAGPHADFVLTWDIGSITFIGLWSITMWRTLPLDMPARAEAQEDGEWTVFAVSLAAIFWSLFVVILEFHNAGSLKGSVKLAHLALVIGTLLISWLTTQLIFALRYAHEFYAISDGSAATDGGLDFPQEPEPDYFDFVYFSMVLGMTFQVSDVQITSRKIRRLATLHGFIGFMFNTVILALTVNISANFL